MTNKLVVGWSLLETLVAISIMAIIAIIVLPSYQTGVIQTQREQAESQLITLSLTLENYFLNHGHYDAHALTAASLNNPHYRINVAINKNAYQLQATPIGKQHKDPCGRLMLDSNEIKSATKPNCWTTF